MGQINEHSDSDSDPDSVSWMSSHLSIHYILAYDYVEF